MRGSSHVWAVVGAYTPPTLAGRLSRWQTLAMDVVLKTDRLVLRRFTGADAEDPPSLALTRNILTKGLGPLWLRCCASLSLE